MDKLNADVIIIGGSLGGTIAAYSACTEGMNCVLAESGKWLGGQLTSQAVPPDEHKYIETTAAPRPTAPTAKRCGSITGTILLLRTK